MKRIDILKTYGKADRNEIMHRLTSLGNRLFNGDWEIIKGVSSSTIPITLNEQCKVQIGRDYLNYTCHPSEANKAGYVLAVEHIYHEHRHVQQQTTEQKVFNPLNVRLDERRMTDIVRRKFVSGFYHSVYDCNYEMDPSEMDAEVYGLRNTMAYFESDPLITKEEAGSILFDFMMSEEYGHKNELEVYMPESISEVISSFVDLRNISVHKPYILSEKVNEVFSRPMSHDMTERFLHEPRFEAYRKEFMACMDGRLQDKLLEQTIVIEYPEHITAVPRLENELRQCYEQMNKRLFKPKTSVIPVSKIQYAGSLEYEDEFTAAVESIPADEDINYDK